MNYVFKIIEWLQDLKMMDITLKQLFVFVSVAKGGGLAEGARRVGLTRGAASMSLSSLEAVAGGALFTRAGKGLRLNDRGRRLLGGAEGLVLGAEEWLASARERSGELVGELRLGCSLTIGNYCLPPLMQRFQSLHPRARVAVRIVNSRAVGEGLRSGAFDLGLVETEDLPYDLLLEEWAKDELVVVCKPNDPLTGLLKLTPRDLSGRVWVVREPGSGTREMAQVFLKRVPLVEGLVEMGGAEAIKRAVMAGMGLALLSRYAVADELRMNTLCELSLHRSPRRSFRLAQVPGQHLSSLASGFIHWLRHNKPD